MNLIIKDHGDESVGIFSASYTMETPIEETDDLEEIEGFRELAIKMFSEFARGKVTAMYDLELKKIENAISDQNRFFMDMESYDAGFSCNNCGEHDEANFSYQRRVANGEIWNCKRCNTEVITPHKPNEDNY